MSYGRTSGILLHVTSIPSPFGIGDLGPESERFVRWLASARQGVWQTLPLNPTSRGGSPYGALSAFAGNPWLISPERLLADGWVGRADLPDERRDDAVDFEAVAREREHLLRTAWSNAESNLTVRDEIDAWSAEAGEWLEDWVLFATIRAMHADRSWTEWPEPLRHREPAALHRLSEERGNDLRYHEFVQWLFHRQWDDLHRYASDRDVFIFGDAPIYVALDSADVWANPELFLLDDDLQPTVVAGVPPDYFSETGQRWGNPIYDWQAMRRRGFRWWRERLRTNFRMVDVLRLDHFRAFAGYWEIPASEDTAVNGQWQAGPGLELFQQISDELGELPLVAEDLGTITPDVEDLLERTGYPGMKVMQFGFGDPENIHLPHRYVRNMVGYTGTHDNDTFLGWFRNAGETERRHAIRYLDARSEGDVVPAAIEALHRSRADVAIIPMQDVLGLGSEARMNTPGTVEGNWRWRLPSDALTDGDADRLARLVTKTGRTEPLV